MAEERQTGTELDATSGGRPAVSTSGALEAFPLLDRESRRRHDTDTRLSFGMYLVLSFFTLGIYAIYVEYKLIDREQEHFKRMGRFNDDLYKLIEERADEVGTSKAVSKNVDEIRALNDQFQRLQQGKERSPALWTILSLLTLGLLFFYVRYFLTADMREHQRAEAEYIERASAVLNRLGIGKHPVQVEQVVPDRSFPLYLLLTFVTLGLFGLYWSFVLIKDGNEHFSEHERFEDQLMATIRASA